MSMLGAIAEYFGRAVEDFSDQTPANQVAIGVTLASVTLLPILGNLWSFLRVRDKTGRIRRLEVENRALASERDKAEKDAEQERNFAALWIPERWLEKADREHNQGNHESAIRILSNGLDNVSSGIASVARQLADYALSLMAEKPPEQVLDQASRYARLAALLEPGDRETALVVDEIIGAQAEHEAEVASEDLVTSSLPVDIAAATTLIYACDRQATRFAHGGFDRLALNVVRRGVLAAKRAQLHNEEPGQLIRLREAEAQNRIGNGHAALELITELLPQTERLFGSFHPNYLAARALETQILWNIGNYADALHRITADLPVTEKMLGSAHPHVLSTRLLEVQILYSDGNTAEAERKLTNLLPDMVEVLGDEDSSVFVARYLEAQLLSKAGEPHIALEKVTALLRVETQVQGAEHPGVLQTRWLRARCLAELGEIEAALEEWRAILPLQREKMKDTHGDVRDTLAMIEKYEQSGEPPESASPVS